MRVRILIAVLVLITAAVAGYLWMRPLEVLNQLHRASLRYDGFKSEWIEVNGIRVHYYVGGPQEGQPVVLVHGLGGRAEDWRVIASEYSTWMCRVYMIDLPGFGQSDRPTSFSYAVGDQAEIVNGFLQNMGINRTDLGGWSMGGWIAQLVAIRHPERVRKLLLFDSAGLYFIPSWNVHLFTPSSVSELDELNRLLSPQAKKIPAFLARDILRENQQNAWIIQRAMDSMLTGQDTTDNSLRTLHVPVLLLWGEDDLITPYSEGERISHLVPQSQIMSFTGCGHMAPIECGEKMASVAIEFTRN